MPDHLLQIEDGLLSPVSSIVRGDLLLEELVLFLEADQVEGMVDEQDHLFQGEGLLDEIEGPELGRLHGRFDGAVPRHHDDLDLRGVGLDHLEGFDPVHAGKPDVQKNQVGRVFFDDLEGLLAASDGPDLVALVGQDPLQGLADALFVVDNQDRFIHGLFSGGGRLTGPGCVIRAPLCHASPVPVSYFFSRLSATRSWITLEAASLPIESHADAQ